MNLDDMTINECLAVSQKDQLSVEVEVIKTETINIDISGQIFTVDKKKVMENSVIINNILLENPFETNI